MTDDFPHFIQPVSELIRRRYSCRTYVEEPLAAETRRRLEEYIAACRRGALGGPARFALAAGDQDNLRELKGLGTYGFIKGATGFIVGATPENARHLEDFGYLLERIILYATDLGLGTCWLGGTFTKTGFGSKINVQAGELVPSVAAVGYIAEKPRRIEALLRRHPKGQPERRLPWERLFFEGSFDQPLQDAGDYREPLAMLRLAPSASNKQPWRVVRQGQRWHFYLQRTQGYRESRLVRIFTVADLQRIDLGIAMCHFELTAREIGLAGGWRVEEPSIHKADGLTEYVASWVD